MSVSFYKYLGLLFVALAGIGVVLPLVPTTPFLLLAAGCFARSSQRWHDWLMTHPLSGNMLQNWQENQCISLRTKIISMSSMTIFGGYSLFFAIDNTLFRIAGFAIILTGFYYVSRIRTCPKAP